MSGSGLAGGSGVVVRVLGCGGLVRLICASVFSYSKEGELGAGVND